MQFVLNFPLNTWREVFKCTLRQQKSHKNLIPLPITIDSQATGAANTFVQVLSSLFNELNSSYTQLLILCIGSDRSTGDSLGPLVGNILKNLPLQNQNVTVMGTLSQPVHALNLKETRDLLANNFKSAAILAIDACLGQKNKIGCLEIGKGHLPRCCCQNLLILLAISILPVL